MLSGNIVCGRLIDFPRPAISSFFAGICQCTHTLPQMYGTVTLLSGGRYGQIHAPDTAAHSTKYAPQYRKAESRMTIDHPRNTKPEDRYGTAAQKALPQASVPMYTAMIQCREKAACHQRKCTAHSIHYRRTFSGCGKCRCCKQQQCRYGYSYEQYSPAKRLHFITSATAYAADWTNRSGKNASNVNFL